MSQTLYVALLVIFILVILFQDVQGRFFDQIEPVDLIQFGLISEFVGRFPVTAATRGLSLEQMVEILTVPKNAIMKQYAYQFALHGVELVITPGANRLIAQEALKRKTGARGLRSIVEKLLTTAMFVIPDKDYCHTVLIDEAAVRGDRSVLLIKGDLTVEKYLEQCAAYADDNRVEPVTATM